MKIILDLAKQLQRLQFEGSMSLEHVGALGEAGALPLSTDAGA